MSRLKSTGRAAWAFLAKLRRNHPDRQYPQFPAYRPDSHLLQLHAGGWYRDTLIKASDLSNCGSPDLALACNKS